MVLHCFVIVVVVNSVTHERKTLASKRKQPVVMQRNAPLSCLISSVKQFVSSGTEKETFLKKGKSPSIHLWATALPKYRGCCRVARQGCVKGREPLGLKWTALTTEWSPYKHWGSLGDVDTSSAALHVDIVIGKNTPFTSTSTISHRFPLCS